MGLFISAMLRNDKEAGTSQEQLGQLSRRKFEATFLNGKEIEVEYDYDPGRLHRDRVKINLQDLLRVFGGITMPPDGRKFVSTFDAEDCLKTNPNLHECSGGTFIHCSHFDAELEKEGDMSPCDHFHHYSPRHVDAWFKFYLTTAIMLREGAHAEVFELESAQDDHYLANGDRLTPEYWLRYAHRKGCGYAPKTFQ